MMKIDIFINYYFLNIQLHLAALKMVFMNSSDTIGHDGSKIFIILTRNECRRPSLC